MSQPRIEVRLFTDQTGALSFMGIANAKPGRHRSKGVHARDPVSDEVGRVALTTA